MGSGSRVDFHPAVADEIRAAWSWYAERNAAAATKFQAAVVEAIARIGQAPERWPAYLRGTRRYTIRTFPYLIIYRVVNSHVQVLACSHVRRRPRYWAGRLR